MTKSFTDKKIEQIKDLPEILKKRVIRYNGHHYIRVKWVQTYLEHALKSQLEFIKGEVVPEKKDDDTSNQVENEEAFYWNNCRKSILNNFKRLEK